MYFLLVFLLLPLRLGRYDYQLYPADPGSSPVIGHLSDLFAGQVLLYGVVAMGSMLFLTYAGLLIQILGISILVAWLPIVLLFISGQVALRAIITRGKRLALSEIQARIERVQAGGDLAEKETMEKVNRLMDLHDRVKGSKDSALNLRAGLDFLNTLLLPLLGSLLGRVNDLGAFFQKLLGD
jgi:hypothetical protein